MHSKSYSSALKNDPVEGLHHAIICKCDSSISRILKTLLSSPIAHKAAISKLTHSTQTHTRLEYEFRTVFLMVNSSYYLQLKSTRDHLMFLIVTPCLYKQTEETKSSSFNLLLVFLLSAALPVHGSKTQQSRVFTSRI